MRITRMVGFLDLKQRIHGVGGADLESGGCVGVPDRPARLEFSQTSICLASSVCPLDRASCKPFCAISTASDDCLILEWIKARFK